MFQELWYGVLFLLLTTAWEAHHIDSLHSPQHSVTTVVVRSMIKSMHHIKALSIIWKSNKKVWMKLHIMAKMLTPINVNMKWQNVKLDTILCTHKKISTCTQWNKSITTKSSDDLYSWLLATSFTLTFLITPDVSNQACLKTMHKDDHVLTVIRVKIYICMWWVHTRYKAQHSPISHVHKWLKRFVAHPRMLNPEMSYFLIPWLLLTLQLHVYT